MHDDTWWIKLGRWFWSFLGFEALPDAASPKLQLDHPTVKERIAIWELTSDAWKDALTEAQYIEEAAYLTTVPLAMDGGMTLWVLVDSTMSPDQRPILASCETFRKRSLVSDVHGDVTETLTHGVASVYCDPKYRHRGYASRLMRELSAALPHWQAEDPERPVAASVLFSDIGPQFYAALGWRPFPSYHLEFEPVALDKGDDLGAAHVSAGQVAGLCKEDEDMARREMARPQEDDEKRTRFMILPDLDHMLWHHRKEEFVCDALFGKKPKVKGAIAGQPGNRVWAIWTHRFYRHPSDEAFSDNTLYILRLAVENGKPDGGLPRDCKQTDLPVKELKAVIQAAQAEAAAWKLHKVVLWGPSPYVEEMVRQTGLQHRREEREEDGICCLQWYMNGRGHKDSLDWIGNEKYGWC